MRSIITILIITSTFLNVSAQQDNYLSVETIKKKQSFSFPIFEHPSKLIVSEKINQLLQISELEILRGAETKHIFEEVSSLESGIYGGKVSIQDTILSNTNKLLSIALDQSSCGMTCAYWIKYYNFNAQNGDAIQLEDIFKKNSFDALKQKIAKKRTIHFLSELKRLKINNEQLREHIKRAYQKDDLVDFYINGNTLYIDGENSFHKNDKFYGIETISMFPISFFQDYLNDYGKALFGLSDTELQKYSSNSFPQLYKGTIANQSVLLVLRPYGEDSIEGEYVYTKYGRGIYLDGSWKDKELKLEEHNAQKDEIALIQASFNGKELEGTWSEINGTRIHKVKLERK